MPDFPLCLCGCGQHKSSGRGKYIQGHSSRSCHGTISQRFWRFVNKTETCWLWTASTRGSYNYGQASIGHGKAAQAHRVSYELANGPIPDGLFVLHRCDTPACVNPEHLFLGTHQDNIDDAKSKGRLAVQKEDKSCFARGENAGKSKLTEMQVLQIRDLHGKVSVLEMSKIFGISSQSIYDIINRKSWRHLP